MSLSDVSLSTRSPGDAWNAQLSGGSAQIRAPGTAVAAIVTACVTVTVASGIKVSPGSARCRSWAVALTANGRRRSTLPMLDLALPVDGFLTVDHPADLARKR
jgi:hypothetical protein